MPPEVVWSILALLLGLAGGSGAAFILLRRQERANLNSSQHRAAELIAHAQKEAENLRKEAELKAKDELFKIREDFNREVYEVLALQRAPARRLLEREDMLQHQFQLQ